MKEMRELIENYQSNLDKLTKLESKLIELLQYNTKITPSYSLDAGGSKGSVSSKVERHALKIYETEEKIMEIGNKLATVNNAQKVLTNKENEVIDLIKLHRNKLSKIARILGKDRNYVFHVRNRAIRKMCKYIRGEKK
jgi:DNA-binding CsgD family transcriptional regulator